MHLLRQSTVATVLVGPVLDSTGAAVTTAVVGDFKISKNGTSSTLSGATVTHDANGYYNIALTTGNTDTAGRFVIYSGNTAHSMGAHRFTVLLPSVFDALITNATNAAGGLPTATGAISAFAGAISTFNRATETVTVETNNDKTGYSLTQAFPANFASLAITVGGAVTAGTVSDKSGYSLTQSFPANFASMSIDASGRVLLQPTQTGVTIPTVTSLTNGVTVSDKTGFSLASNGLASITSWSVAITGNITGNLSGSVGSVTGNVGGNVTGSVGSIAGVTFPTNFGLLGINGSGHVSRVVLVDTTTTNTDMRGTDGAALATHWTSTRAGYLDGVLLASNYNQRTVAVTGSHHVAADIHELQPAVIDNTHFAAGAIDDNALASSAVTEIGVGVWVSAGYAAAIRAAVGLAAADLDSQFDAIPSDVWNSGSAPTSIRAAMGLAASNLDSQLAAAMVLQKLAASGATGSVQVTDNGNGTATLVFKDTNGSTTLATVTYNYTSGARTRVS